MASRVKPEQLAELFETEGSESPRLKEGATIGGIDSFQMQFNGGPDLVGVDLATGPTRISGGFYWVDLSDYAQVKFKALVTTAGNTAAIQLYYSLNGTDLIVLTQESCSLAATGLIETSWEAIPAAAKTIVGIEGQTFGGNGTEDPVAKIIVHFQK